MIAKGLYRVHLLFGKQFSDDPPCAHDLVCNRKRPAGHDAQKRPPINKLGFEYFSMNITKTSVGVEFNKSRIQSTSGS
jgi:hypothetical protein